MSERPPEGPAATREDFRPVVDPTSRLLGQLGEGSRFPWIPVGFVVLLVLWIASMPRIATEPPSAEETGWIAETIHPADASPGSSALARSLSRAAWTWQGAAPEAGRPLTTSERVAVRSPAALATATALVTFWFLGRLVVGNAASLLGACLLAIATPWIRAGTSALPLLAGETMVLLGVTWALVLHARHREVEIAAVNALRIGVAGAFLGIGLLLAPATFASFVTTLLLWFVLGLRRSSSDATTLPVGSPRRTVALAIVGALVLLGATVLVSAFAERMAGGDADAFVLPALANVVPEASLWPELHRGMLSPGPRTDLLLVVALAVIALVRVVERRGGRPWQATGILPWVYLGLHFRIAGEEARARGALELPLTVTPLLVVGLGWIVLRGLRPGRVRRQEYGFAVTWLLASVLLLPFVPGGHPHAPALAAAVSLLPPLLLVTARGARSLWDAADGELGRGAIFGIAYLPVVLFAADAVNRALEAPAALDGALRTLRDAMPSVLLALAALGVLSVILAVRPEAPVAEAAPPRPRGRRGRRGARAGRGSRRGGRRYERGPRP